MAQATCRNQDQGMNPNDRTANCSDCGRNLVILSSGYFRSHKVGSAKLAATVQLAAPAAAEPATVSEAVRTAQPIRGTDYTMGSFTPTVGLSAKPRTIYVLFLTGVEVDRGSKSDLMMMATSAAGSPLGACHERYEAIRDAVVDGVL